MSREPGPGAAAEDDQLFRALLESAPDAMVIVDFSGTIRLVNAQTERMFGYDRSELLGQPMEKLVPSRYRGSHALHRQNYARDPRVRRMGSGLTLYGLHKDQSEFPVEISLSPLQSRTGGLISSSIRDITDRKQAEAAARLASDRLLSAIESIQDGVALYDAKDELVLCNSTLRQLFAGAVTGPIVGRTHAELFDAAIALPLLELGTEPVVDFRRRIAAYHDDPLGTLDFKLRSGRTLRMTDRRTLEGGVVSTIWDVTDDVALVADRQHAQDLAEAASEAKSEFLSSMSHELRTPLNSILGFAQLLQLDKKHPLTERQQGKLEHVVKGGEHLLRLIDDILDLSHIEAGRVMVSPEAVEIAPVLEEVMTALKPMAARAGISVTIEAGAAGQVVADRTRFSQILINFGSNAIKYGKPGGRAALGVSTPADGLVRVSVSDDGIGIPLDKHDRIFQPFQRAGQETGPIQGTGIGLSITKRLAELMGGSVGFESTPGQGSTFWVDLPEHRVDPSAEVPSPAEHVAGSRLRNAEARRHTIVYIEDNPSNIAFMQSLIDELDGVDLVTSPTAEVGLEIVRASLPDVVLMDINLPGMSGYEATQMLGAWPETKHIPVIALTAAAMLDDRKRAAEAGFYRYLTKPVRVPDLLQTLAELFER
jgi:PAS domain S-box-containing protein